METAMASALMQSTVTMATPDAAQHDVTNAKHRTSEGHTGHTVTLPINPRYSNAS